MLDGNVGTEIEGGNKNSYGYIDLSNISLYLNVYEKQDDVYLKIVSVEKYITFITALIMIGAFVSGWKYIKKIDNYSNKYSNSREYSRKLKVLDNLESYIDEVDDMTEELLETNSKIHILKLQIKSIRNSLDMKRVK
jgi:hypothetical protein